MVSLDVLCVSIRYATTIEMAALDALSRIVVAANEGANT